MYSDKLTLVMNCGFLYFCFFRGALQRLEQLLLSHLQPADHQPSASHTCCSSNSVHLTHLYSDLPFTRGQIVFDTILALT